MKRTLKMLFLLLFVSTVSFVYAQDEIDGADKGGKSLVKDNAKKGVDKTGDPGSAGDAKKPTPQRMASHETGKAGKEKELGKGKRSEEHTSELQSQAYLVCRLLLEKKNNNCGVIPVSSITTQFLPLFHT